VPNCAIVSARACCSGVSGGGLSKRNVLILAAADFVVLHSAPSQDCCPPTVRPFVSGVLGVRPVVEEFVVVSA